MAVETDHLRLAVRGYPERNTGGKKRVRRRRIAPPTTQIFLDCETRVDKTQRLTFGSYRIFENGRCTEEGLFYADDLSAAELATLAEYARTHQAEVAPPYSSVLHLRDRRDFLDILYKAAFKGRCLVVGFNLPFDLSRLAFKHGPAREEFAGGFSFALWDWARPDGTIAENRYRPRVTIKHVDSKRALKSFTKTAQADFVDLIPEGSKDGKADPLSAFRGHLLDLKTLAFALTDRGHSLACACETFGVEHQKLHVEHHGVITPEYIDYNRRDVLATAELHAKLMEEYERHPIDLQATKAYSPASIGKKYLRAMGIIPVLERQPDFSKTILGNAMSAFYGGRSGAHIRRAPVPIVYTDFLSMYPTNNALMGLWRFITARRIETTDATPQIRRFLARLTIDTMFDPKQWRKMAVFVQLEPQDDILPARCDYDPISKDWQVGVNYLRTKPGGTCELLWYSLPDVVASVLLTGRVPNITRAIRLVPLGRQRGLHPVRLRGDVFIDPRKTDFFKVVIEERKRLANRTDLPERERERLDKALKILANATAYGILAEMVAHELGGKRKEQITVYGCDDEPFTCSVSAPEEPGEFCFPPLAALITGAAKLQLALLERCVTDLGGTYAMEDTDSMTIVATEHGGPITCTGGKGRTEDGQDAVLALSWAQVRAIADRFEGLNPYDGVPGVLKIEKDNFTPGTTVQRQIYCFAISAKRYALFVYGANDEPELLQKGVNSATDGWSEHGLGHLLNPTDPDSDDRDWIRQIWLYLLRQVHGLPGGRPAWFNRPALSRISVSSPAVLKPFSKLNEGKPYRDQVKPFNFLLSAHIAPEGHPIGADPDHFHLVAPYESDPRKWSRIRWIEQYTGKEWRATTLGPRGARKAARLKTYGDVVAAYAYHPEAKSADADGNPCGKQTVGRLLRRRVTIGSLTHIGKESNRLEEVQAGTVADAEEIYQEYRDPKRTDWETEILPALRRMQVRRIHDGTGLARSTIQRLRNRGQTPQAKTIASLRRFLESATRSEPVSYPRIPVIPNRRVRDTPISGRRQ